MKKKIESVISLISPDLQMLKDLHFVIGSCAVFLSGMPIDETSDLDLFVSHDDAEHLKAVWANRRRENYAPCDTHLFRSNFGRFYFGDLDVEVMGGLKVFSNSEWKSLQIEKHIEVLVGDQKIKIPTLEEQQRIFNFFGRDKDILKAKKIEKHC
jgi:phosphorylcholine metabolism protein LicD